MQLGLIGNSKGLCMNLFVWTQALATGNKAIDEEHQELVRRVNAVLEAIATRQRGRGLSLALNELLAYAREHFAREELAMRQVNFRNIGAHAAEHANLLKQALEVQAQLEAGERIDQMDLYHFLARWVKDHIQHMDADLVAALAVDSVK